MVIVSRVRSCTHRLYFAVDRPLVRCAAPAPCPTPVSLNSSVARVFRRRSRAAAAAKQASGPSNGAQPGKGSSPGPDTAAVALPKPPERTGPTPPLQSKPLGLREYHYATFFTILVAGVAFLAVLLYLQAGIEIQQAIDKVVRRLLKTVALRQVGAILAAMTFVRFGLEPLMKCIRSLFRAPGSWERSPEHYILREVYRPLEFLFTVAAFTTLIENFLPQLIALPKALIQSFVRSTLTLTFVIAAARVVFNIKARIMVEREWQLEIQGELTKQRRIEAIDKLLSVLTLIVASVFGLQAIGLDVNSVLAIGGVGGLAVGLAGREILENLFTGLIILSSSPFEVGEEINFTSSSSRTVEGIVVDVGWYRTTIRSFEREIYTIPNSVFSRNVVLNITRKQKEWRFFEFFGVRVQDIGRVSSAVSDMRKILRQDPRIIQKLHRRVFLDGIDRDQGLNRHWAQLTVYISCYVEAQNRDAFMAVRQDLMLAFVDCVHRNRAELARTRLGIEVTSTTSAAAASVPRSDPETRSSTAQDADTITMALPASTLSGEEDPSDPSPSSPSGPTSAPSGDPGDRTERREVSVAGTSGASSSSGSGPSGPSSSSSSNTGSASRRKELATAAAKLEDPRPSQDAANVVPRAPPAPRDRDRDRPIPKVTPDQSLDAEQMGSLMTASFDEIPASARMDC